MMPAVCTKLCLVHSYFLDEEKQPREQADGCVNTGDVTDSPGAVMPFFLSIP